MRKRNDGDNQAVLATRTWGLNSSARTLIYDDDLLVSALIGNNNSGASPHWNLIVPETISRIDFLNGPYAAMYPGNSMGGVLLVTTKMPDKFEADVKETVSVQPWNQYATKNTYVIPRQAHVVGNRNGALSWFAAINFLDGYQQPLTYTTNGSAPAGTTGTFPALNKQGVVADVVGTGALIHTQQTTANFKAAYDFTNTIQATYSLGLWNNIQTSNPQSYLTSTATGLPTFGGVTGFASNEYIWNQTHMSNAVSLKSDTKGMYDFDLSVSSYNYLQDILLNPIRSPLRSPPLRKDFPKTGRSRATTARIGRTRTPNLSGGHTASTALRKLATACTATAIISTIRFTARRPGTRHSPAPARFIPTASVKRAPGRCGRKMPGSSRQTGS